MMSERSSTNGFQSFMFMQDRAALSRLQKKVKTTMQKGQHRS